MRIFGSLLRPTCLPPVRIVQLIGAINTMTKGKATKVLYFGFGSNMSSERIHINCKSAVFKAVGLLKGYQLEFCFKSRTWGGSAANIISVEDRESSHVYGILWELERHDRDNLDKQEGVAVGIYERIYVNAEIDGVYHECLAYQLTEKTRTGSISTHGRNQTPSKIYKSFLIRGAKEHNVPQDYITYLENLPDNGFNGPVNLHVPDGPLIE